MLSRHEAVDAVPLIRDRDDQPGRRRGLERGRATFSARVRVVIGLTVPERECWVIGGFEPKDEIERGKLEEEIQHLGFHPCRESHPSTACNDDQARRSARRVHAKRIGGDRDRESECWRGTALSVLAEQGADNGLRDYLHEVKGLLVPLITGYEGKPGDH